MQNLPPDVKADVDQVLEAIIYLSTETRRVTKELARRANVTARSPSPPDRSLSGVSREVLESAKDAAVKANVAEAQIKAGNGASVSLDDLAALASFYA